MPQFRIMGNDIQHLLIDLGPGEKVYAEGGHLIWKQPTVNIRAAVKGGLLAELKRALTGATFFVLEIEGPGQVDLAGFAPGKIVEIELDGSRG